MTRVREVLLTGATGFLGKVVLHDLLRRRAELGIGRIHLVVRPQAAASAEARVAGEVIASPALAGLRDAAAGLVSPLAADLAEPGALAAAAAPLEAAITHVVHCAASVDFDLPLAAATSANVESALHVLELARRCSRLVSMASVSTAYVTPHPGDRRPVEERLAPLPRPAAELLAAIRSGAVDEAALLRETGHPNTYTLTKCLAEHLLLEARGSVPLSLVRPSIISASWQRPAPGWIDSPAAFAFFVMAIATGRMRAVVARRRARLDVVPCDEVSERVIGAAFDPPAGGSRILHAVAGYERSIPNETSLDGLHDWFQRNPVTTARQGPARVHYVGPEGFRYRYHHWRHHQRRSELVAARVDETNRRFAYFTTHSFRFRSSAPLVRPDFEPRGYLERICRGVAVHLLDADFSRVSLAGRRHPHAGSSPWTGTLAELDRRAEWVSFDLASFERALAARGVNGGARPLLLAPTEAGTWHRGLLELLARARGDLWTPRPRVAGAPGAGAAESGWDELRVRVEQHTARRAGADALGRFHLVCEGLVADAPVAASTAPRLQHRT